MIPTSRHTSGEVYAYLYSQREDTAASLLVCHHNLAQDEDTFSSASTAREQSFRLPHFETLPAQQIAADKQTTHLLSNITTILPKMKIPRQLHDRSRSACRHASRHCSFFKRIRRDQTHHGYYVFVFCCDIAIIHWLWRCPNIQCKQLQYGREL